MNQQQLLITIILSATMALFLWGRFRHDVVASGALLSAVLLGVVPAEQAFLGFSHPAVITVAAILVLSRGLQTSGAVDVLAHRLLPKSSGVSLSLLTLIGLGALLSSFMNNVGAMALWRYGAVNADCDKACAAFTTAAWAGAYAARLWHYSRRHDHIDRHAAESHRFWFSRHPQRRPGF